MTDVEKAASLSEVLRVALDDHLAMHKRCVAQGGGSRGMSPDEAYEDGASEFHNDLQEMRGAIANAAVCNEWQPIEDAKKENDLPPILGRDSKGDQEVIFWRNGWYSMSYRRGEGLGSISTIIPTHFRLIEGPAP